MKVRHYVLKEQPPVDRLKSTRRVLVQVIKLATRTDLQQESHRLFSLFDLWVRTKGVRSATLRLKNMHHMVLNHSLSQTPVSYPFIGSVKGFPKQISFLKKYCTTLEGKQAVLSLLAYWRGVRAPGTPSLETITRPLSVKIPVGLEQAILSVFPSSWKFRLEALSQVTRLFTSRFGPNGKALWTSLSDLKSIVKDSNLLESIREILTLTDSEEFSEWLDDLVESVDMDEITDNCIHSRLSVKQELGGKDRIFAIIDYFTQCTLKPLHTKVAKILGTIPSDGTFDQNIAAERVRRWTAEEIPLYSYDLSAATDRFPASLQRGVVEKLTGSDEYADSWADLMTNREFKFRKKSGIKYAVGQPMGAYSSWPVFAITHHLIVMYAAKQAKILHPEYTLLGDDIVLRSTALAESYLHTIKLLGVEISMEKSVTGKVAEFAKRLFIQGREISAIPVRLISSWKKDFRLVRELRNRLVLQSCLGIVQVDSVQSGLLEITKSLHSSRLEQTRILLTAPCEVRDGLGLPLNLGGKVYLGCAVLADWHTLMTITKYKYLVERYSEQVKMFQPAVGSWACAQKSQRSGNLNLPEFPGLDTGNQDLHPVNLLTVQRLAQTKKAHKALGKYWTALTQQGLKADLPVVNLPDIRDLTPSFQKRLKLEAKIILETHEAFQGFLRYKMTHPDGSVNEFIQSLKQKKVGS